MRVVAMYVVKPRSDLSLLLVEARLRYRSLDILGQLDAI
jgi:hypothetical protein